MFILRWITGCIIKFVLLFAVSSVVLVFLYRYVPVYVTPLMVIRAWGNFQQGKPWRWEHKWVELEKISEKLQLAVVCSEDQNFTRHHGFDWDAIKKAFHNNKKGKRIIGGSTITQQTAKNIFLWPGRNYQRKGLEAWFTFLIELCWPKERIMEVYLNSVEMGNNVYGAAAASRHWFGKDCNRLSTDEAAALAAILPNPRHWKAQPPSPYVIKRKAWIKKQMAFWGFKLDYDINASDPDEKK